MFSASQYTAMYRKFLGSLGQPVTLEINNGTGWDSYPGVMAHVSSYRESDLVSGGSIILGDLKLIFMTEDLPVGVTKLALKDRVTIEGRSYGVVHFDPNTRTVGETPIAVECGVRG